MYGDAKDKVGLEPVSGKAVLKKERLRKLHFQQGSIRQLPRQRVQVVEHISGNFAFTELATCSNASSTPDRPCQLAFYIHPLPASSDNDTMATSGYPTQNGAVNGSHKTTAVNGTRRTRSRPFTVEEAVPYSGFSSVVPFNSSACTAIPSTWSILLTRIADIIPLPKIGARSSVSLFSTPADRAAGRQGLDRLNREVEANPHNASQGFNQELESVLQLLNSNGTQ